MKYMIPVSISTTRDMAGMVDKIVKNYKSLAQFPALLGGQILSPNLINTTWSQRNIEKGTTTKFNRSILLNNLNPTDTLLPVDVSNEILSKISKTQNLRAVLREGDSKQFLEIWKNSHLFRVVDLTTLDLHGNVYADVEFGVLEFSPDETKLLYVAEKKVPKSEPFYKRQKPKEDGDDSKPAPKGQEFLFEQDWGEQLVGKKKSILVEYNITTDTVEILKGLPDNICVAKPKYSKDGSYIIGLAYFIDPRKLGLIYCSNRPSTIFQLGSDGKYFELELPGKAVKSPIFTPNGTEIVWLQRDAGGPHMACMALVKTIVPLSNKSVVKEIVSIVKTKKDISNGKTFYGIYNMGFPQRPWIGKNKLCLNTNQKYTINSYIIDTESGEVDEVVNPDGSILILDVKDDLILGLKRSFFTPDFLVISKVPQSSQTIDWTEITPKAVVPELEGSTYKYLDLVAPEGDVVDFNAIYLGPSKGTDNSVPLIVWPHGGPHSVFGNYYFLEEAVFLSLGYSILLVNYRGSIGSGDDSVNFLLGKVGTSDVKDCVQAVDTVLKECPWLNSKKVALCGGSHGGFIVAHLSGQYPDKFKSVVARNPVIDVASMSIISDIPDWCYVEAGYSYTQKGEIDNDVLMFMRKASPIIHAHKVKAPTLLQIGSKDLRVPQYQGHEYYYRLKANGVKVRMNLYDDNHPLGTVPNEIDNMINTILWTEENIGWE